MDDIDIDDNFDSPQARMAMRKRHLRAALEMQAIAAQGLAELRQRGDLTLDECKQLLDAGLQLEREAAPGGSRKRH